MAPTTTTTTTATAKATTTATSTAMATATTTSTFGNAISLPFRISPISEANGPKASMDAMSCFSASLVLSKSPQAQPPLPLEPPPQPQPPKSVASVLAKGTSAAVTTSISAATTAANTTTTVYGNGHSRSLTLERPTSSVSRRHSWTSLNNPPNGLSNASSMLRTDSEPGPGNPRRGVSLAVGNQGSVEATATGASPDVSSSDKHLAGLGKPHRHRALQPLGSIVLRPGATFEMAYFLKTTGPSLVSENESDAGSCGVAAGVMQLRDASRKGANAKRPGWGRFGWTGKVASVLGVGLDNDDDEAPQENFVPNDKVVQKISKDGKKYLQIVTDIKSLDLSGNDELSDGERLGMPARLSVNLSDQTDIIGTEALDSWISTFSTSNHQNPDIWGQSTMPSEDPPINPWNAFSVQRANTAGTGGFGDPAIDPPGVDNAEDNSKGHHYQSQRHFMQFDKIEESFASESEEPGKKRHRLDPEARSAPSTSYSNMTTSFPDDDHLIRNGRVDRFARHKTIRSVHSKKASTVRSNFMSNFLDDVFADFDQSFDDSILAPDFTTPTIQEHTRMGWIKDEPSVRVQNMRKLQRARRNIDEVMNTSLVNGELNMSDNTLATNPERKVSNMRSSSTRRPYTPLLNAYFCQQRELNTKFSLHEDLLEVKNGFSPIMTVAEQIPSELEKTRKGASGFNARDRQLALKRSSAPVRNESMGYPEPLELGSAAAYTSSAKFCNPEVDLLPTRKRREDAERELCFGEQLTSSTIHGYRSSEKPTHGFPTNSTSKTASRHASVASRSGSIRHRRFPTPPPKAVTLIKTPGNRTSICSSHTSASKEMRLEARLEALERENKLLEAALMAVLKTSGTLNRCPCVLFSQRSDGLENLAPAGRLDGILANSGHGQKTFANGAKRKAGAMLNDVGAMQEDINRSRKSRGSDGFDGTQLGALEVYLRTRAAALAATTTTTNST